MSVNREECGRGREGAWLGSKGVVRAVMFVGWIVAM